MPGSLPSPQFIPATLRSLSGVFLKTQTRESVAAFPAPSGTSRGTPAPLAPPFWSWADGVQNYLGALRYLPRDNEIIQPTLLLQEAKGDWGEQPDWVVESCEAMFDVPH